MQRSLHTGFVAAFAALLGNAGCATSNTHATTPVPTEVAACAMVQKRVADADALPPGGPPGIGWYCDFATGHDPTLFVIALRSGRQCDGTCSNLVGWYAVRKSDGEVGNYDLNERKWTPITKRKQP